MAAARAVQVGAPHISRNEQANKQKAPVYAERKYLIYGMRRKLEDFHGDY